MLGLQMAKLQHELCVSVSVACCSCLQNLPPCKEVDDAGAPDEANWDPSEPRNRLSTVLTTWHPTVNPASAPLEVSTVFTCFTNSSSLEELSSELKSSMLPTSSVAKLLLHLHLQLLLEVADLVLHASTNLDVEVFSASTCRKSCRCGGLPCLHLLM